MKLTIKKLSSLTGLSPACIRKWRERFNFLEPHKGENGYFYYTSEDYRILMSVKTRLEHGEKLAKIVKYPRESLLNSPASQMFSAYQWAQLEKILENDFSQFEADFNKYALQNQYHDLVESHIHPLTLLVGKAWEAGFISVATEHTFSRWLAGYLLQLSRRIAPKPDRHRLFITFPGDEHELGALMHYTLQCANGNSGKFCGMLPVELVLEELASGEITELFVSVVLPLTKSQIDDFEKTVRKEHPEIKIVYGGYGLTKEEGKK